MRIDRSGADAFLAYLDGETTLQDVWEHPAYRIVRRHATLFGRDLSTADVADAVDGEQTVFGRVEGVEGRREDLRRVLDWIESHERPWIERLRKRLETIYPDQDVDDVRVYLGVGYDAGLGLREGAYVNVHEPPFFESPAAFFHVALHETAHVIYDRVHGFSDEVSTDRLDSPEGRRTFFDAILHAEGYAVYGPRSLRRVADGQPVADHPMCVDYQVLDDERRLREHVERYDALREDLDSGAEIRAERVLQETFGEWRLAYRVGCALVDGIERHLGDEAVCEAFYEDPDEFVSAYDWVLDEYRQ